jgi:SAM-dependent methyltransferase
MIKLNICSGPNIFPFDNWINYDREDFDYYINFLKNGKSHSRASYQRLIDYCARGGKLSSIIHDLRDGFPQHANNSVDLIYVGQAIEHINPIFEVPPFLKECYRMLKPDGVLRMTTPDLDLLINAYLAGEMNKFAIEQPAFYQNVDPSAQLAMLMFGSCGEKCKWDHYEGHFFLYTQKSMTKVLNDAGFSKVFFYYETGKSYSPVMAAEVHDEGMTHSMICEAIK